MCLLPGFSPYRFSLTSAANKKAGQQAGFSWTPRSVLDLEALLVQLAAHVAGHGVPQDDTTVRKVPKACPLPFVRPPDKA